MKRAQGASSSDWGGDMKDAGAMRPRFIRSDLESKAPDITDMWLARSAALTLRRSIFAMVRMRVRGTES